MSRVGLGCAWVLLTATACDEADRFGPIRLDTSPNCVAAQVDVLVPDLDRDDRPWHRVISVAMDEPGSRLFWALVQLRDDVGGAGPFALVHVRDDQVDIQLETPGFLSATTDVTLRPGPAPGAAWIVETGPGSLRVWSLDAAFPDAPLRAISNDLGWFPGGIAQLCEGEFEENLQPCDVTDWHRELAFVEGVPHILSIPPFSPNATMYVYAGRLEPGLSLTEQTQLEFFRRCAQEDEEGSTPMSSACSQEIAETTYPSLVVMGTQQDVVSPTHHQFIVRDRERNRVPVSREAVALVLDLDDNGRLRGFVFSRELKEVELALGPPGGLANDDFAAYLLHPIAQGGARVTRLRTDGPGSVRDGDRFDVLQELPLESDVEMLQMAGDIALGRVLDGTWEVTKLFPDAPERSEVVVYAPDTPVSSVRSAGRGAFVVFKDSEGPDLVQLRCAPRPQ